MRKNDGWLNALFALVFIAVPALIGYYFLLPDWTNKKVISYGAMWGVSFGFAAYVAAFSVILIFTKVLALESLNFNIPLTLVFIALFITYPVPLYGRALIVVALILVAFPVNVMVSNLKRNTLIKHKKNQQ